MRVVAEETPTHFSIRIYNPVFVSIDPENPPHGRCSRPKEPCSATLDFLDILVDPVGVLNVLLDVKHSPPCLVDVGVDPVGVKAYT